MISQSVFSGPQSARAKTAISFAALGFALISISLAALFIKFSEQEVSPYATAFNRFWITTLVLMLWTAFNPARRQAGFTQSSVSASPVDSSLFLGGIAWQLVAVGVFLAADLTLWAWSLTQTSVANATLLANLTPLFTTMVGWLVCSRCFDRRFLTGLVVAIGGALAIGLSDWQMGADKVQGDVAALLAALAFGIYLLILEHLQTKLAPTTIILWSSGIAAVCTLPIVILADGSTFPVSSQGWLAIVSLALICQILGQGLLVYSLNRLSSEFVALFLLLDPVLAALGAWIIFSETLTVQNWVAFGVVMLGIYLALSSKSSIKEGAVA